MPLSVYGRCPGVVRRFAGVRYIGHVGIEVQLQDEFGGRIESVTDPKNFLCDLLPPEDKSSAYPILTGIDPYGDTVFNSVQIPRFLSEWSDVLKNARTADAIVLVKEIERLARRCHAEVHTYLKFIGD